MIDRAMEGVLYPDAASPLPRARRVLVFAPHADDEVFGCGGTLRLLAATGAGVSVVIASDGALGGSPTESAAQPLIAEREEESRRAAQVLGYPAPVFWRLPDRDIRYGETLVARILEEIRVAQADLVFAPALTEPHPDHQALALAAAEAMRRLGGDRRVAFYEIGAPLVPNMVIDITAAEEHKRRAMRCFGSQLGAHPYDEGIAALNRYRAYALGTEVRAAEAFFVVAAPELAHGLTPLFESALGRRRRFGVAIDGTDIPLVSLIVRSLDRPTLGETLASVAAQTYPNIEVIVVNAKGGNHSPLPDFGPRLTLRLVETGAALDRSRAANAGLDACGGRYLGLLDDDDTLDPDHLSQLVAALQREAGAVVVYAGVRCVDRDDPARKVSRVFGEPFESRAKLLAGNFIPSHAALFPRSLIESGARFDETLRVYEDWDFWLQLSEAARFVYVDRVSATYFTGGSSAVSPMAFDPEAVRAAARSLFAKWKVRISPDEFKAMGDLYHGGRAELVAAKEELGRLAERLREVESRLDDAQAGLRSLGEQLSGQAASSMPFPPLNSPISPRLAQAAQSAAGALPRSIDLALSAARRLYGLLPIAVRLRLRPWIAPLSRRVSAGRNGGERQARVDRMPFDYREALARLNAEAPDALRFSEPPAPVISIVVVDQGSSETTLRCLAAFGSDQGVAACEFIVVAADPSAFSARVFGARMERGSGELLDGYARGAALARAPWVLFLSADCRPLPGMLEASQALVSQQPDIGLAVPKLVSDRALLVFPADGAGSGDPNVPEVNFSCATDRCPAFAFLARKPFLEPDEALRVAHRGLMSDLVASVTKRGGRVVYAPHAHATVPAHILDQDSARWTPDNAGSGNRALVLDVHTPTPDMDSGSVDAYFRMQLLGRLGYGITFAAAADLGYQPRYTADLQRIGVECLYGPYTDSVLQHLRQCGQRYRLVVLNRLAVGEVLIDDVRRECPNARVLFNPVDLHFLREQRQAEQSGDRAAARQARSTRRRELEVMRKADLTLVISEAEQALLRKEAPEVKTFHVPLIMDVDDRGGLPFSERKDLFFIGGYRHLPNVDAVLHFAAEIWPRMRERLPGVRFHIVGSHPPPEILALAGPDIVVDGYVADAAPFFHRCRLSVAPLRFGAGLKGKVGRSLGYGCPVVLTPVAAEGMGLTHGRNALLAEGSAEFADAAVRLYEDEILWNALSRESARFFEKHFSVEAGEARLTAMLAAMDH